MTVERHVLRAQDYDANRGWHCTALSQPDAKVVDFRMDGKPIPLQLLEWDKHNIWFRVHPTRGVKDASLSVDTAVQQTSPSSSWKNPVVYAAIVTAFSIIAVAVVNSKFWQTTPTTMDASTSASATSAARATSPASASVTGLAAPAIAPPPAALGSASSPAAAASTALEQLEHRRAQLAEFCGRGMVSYGAQVYECGYFSKEACEVNPSNRAWKECAPRLPNLTCFNFYPHKAGEAQLWCIASMQSCQRLQKSFRDSAVARIEEVDTGFDDCQSRK